MKLYDVVAVLALGVALATACGDDPAAPPPAPGGTSNPAGLAIRTPKTHLEAGDTMVATLDAPVDGGAPAAVQWSTSDEAIATVDPTGTVTGLAAGSFELRASVGASTATAAIVIDPPTSPWTGTKQWGTDNNDGADAIALDGKGDVYVIGGTAGTLPGQKAFGQSDAILVKYLPNGKRAWSRQLGTEGNDNAGAVATDLEGNVYVSGTASNGLEASGSGPGLFVTKYDPAGRSQWVRQIQMGASIGIATDAASNVYVCGDLKPGFDPERDLGVSPTPNGDALLLKYGPDGTRAWVRLLHTTISPTREAARDIGVQCAVGSDGAIYLAGMTVNDDFANPQFVGFLARYRADGEREWVRYVRQDRDDWEPPFIGDTWLLALTTGSDGAVYVGGSFDDKLPFVARYAPDGTRVWRRDGVYVATNDTACVTGLAFDRARSRVLVGGAKRGQPHAHNSDLGAFVLALDAAAGAEQWRYETAPQPSVQGNQNLSVRGIGVDPQGGVFFGGTTNGNLDGNVNLSPASLPYGDDLYVAKLTPEGTRP